MVRDDPKLPDNSGKVPNPNKVVGGSIPNREIVSLLDGKLARWSSASCILEQEDIKMLMFTEFRVYITLNVSRTVGIESE